MNKVCSTCRIDKPLDQYGKNKVSKDGVHYTCKECMSKRAKHKYDSRPAYRAAAKDRVYISRAIKKGLKNESI